MPIDRGHDHGLGRRDSLLPHHPASLQRTLEGINNLLQVLGRVGHGFTNTDNFAARGLLVSIMTPTPAPERPNPTKSRSLNPKPWEPTQHRQPHRLPEAPAFRQYWTAVLRGNPEA